MYYKFSIKKLEEKRTAQEKIEIELISRYCPDCYWHLRHGCHIDIVKLEGCAAKVVALGIIKNRKANL